MCHVCLHNTTEPQRVNLCLEGNCMKGLKSAPGFMHWFVSWAALHLCAERCSVSWPYERSRQVMKQSGMKFGKQGPWETALKELGDADLARAKQMKIHFNIFQPKGKVRESPVVCPWMCSKYGWAPRQFLHQRSCIPEINASKVAANLELEFLIYLCSSWIQIKGQGFCFWHSGHLWSIFMSPCFKGFPLLLFG